MPNKSDDAPKSEAAPPQTEVKTEPTSVPSEVAAKPKAEPVDDSRLMPPPAPAALSPGGVLSLRILKYDWAINNATLANFEKQI